MSQRSDMRSIAVASVLVSLVLVGSHANAYGQGGDADASAVTTSRPDIPVDELELLLKPLTKEELVVEADGWMGLVLDQDIDHRASLWRQPATTFS